MEALLTQRMADAALNARVVLIDCQDRVNQAVADGEMSVTTGREIMALISRAVENTLKAHRLSEEVHKVATVFEIGIRHGYRGLSAYHEGRLRDANLAVIERPKIVHLFPEDDDGRVA